MGALQARMQASAEAAAVNNANQYANEQIQYRFPWCQKVEKMTKIMGTVTVVVLWIIAFSSFGIGLTIGLSIFLIFYNIPVTLLEWNWLISKCPACGGEGFFCTALKFIQTLDTWKRAIFYGIGAVPCFFIGLGSLGGIIAGLFLIVLAVLYVAKTFQFAGGSQPLFSNIPGGTVPPGGIPPSSVQDPAATGQQGNFDQSNYTKYP